jgi:hypothetical protein
MHQFHVQQIDGRQHTIPQAASYADEKGLTVFRDDDGEQVYAVRTNLVESIRRADVPPPAQHGPAVA